MATLITSRKSNPNPAAERDNGIANQIDTLQMISGGERRDILGEDYFKSARALYSLNQNAQDRPRFRPRVIIPELQVMALLEANDLSDIHPKPYLIRAGERDATNEIALQAQARESEINLQLIYADLWEFFCGTAFLQVGWNPNAYQGRGTIQVRARDPETVFPDPYAPNDEEWKYVIWEDYMWIDEIRNLWPERAYSIPFQRPIKSPGRVLGSGTAGTQNALTSLSFPAGPMQYTGNLPSTPAPGDGRLRVRTMFVYDPAIVEKKLNDRQLRDKLALNELPEPERTRKYPYGRLVIEAERMVMFDSNNPFKHGQFPLVRFIGLPALTSFWAPPIARYTRSIQELGERMYTQLFENAVRLNNGVWFIPEDSGVDPNRFGGIPGEVQMVSGGSKMPELKMPPALPAHMIQLPDQLFAIQRRLQGFTDTRTGQTPPGNVSPGFMENAVSQSHGLTQLKAKLHYGSLRRLYYLMFCTMAQYYTSERTFMDPNPGAGGMIKWTPVDQPDGYELWIDPDSVQPFSSSLLANRVMMLRNMGMMSIKSGLKLMKVPDAEENFQNLQQEAQAAAQAAEAKKQTKGGKK